MAEKGRPNGVVGYGSTIDCGLTLCHGDKCCELQTKHASGKLNLKKKSSTRYAVSRTRSAYEQVAGPGSNTKNITNAAKHRASSHKHTNQRIRIIKDN